MSRESDRLRRTGGGWRRWGPYLAERQWGTVREDYSAAGRPWRHTTHEMSRSLAYRWGEEGIAGVCDERQQLCLALALWNGRDPILKERLFGLTGPEGNHGEDVKELYWYLDATPTHSYLRMAYLYPHAEFPYSRLVEESRRRGGRDPELELADTGVLDEGRVFDVQIEYAKASPDDILMQVVARNLGPDEAELHLLPTLWFRNTWDPEPNARRPSLVAAGSDAAGASRVIRADHDELGTMRLLCEGEPRLLVCGNQTNQRRLYGVDGAEGPFKDGINDLVVSGRTDAIAADGRGTRAAAWYRLKVAARGEATIRLRLTGVDPPPAFADFGDILQLRREEADEFYAELQEGIVDPEMRRIQRQALSGLIWSKQRYRYDVERWLDGDPGQPPPPSERRSGRNSGWRHLDLAAVMLMPDTWEFPWFAAWDLAFHCIPMTLVDPELAKEQLVLLTREWSMHPGGQLPAYEWAFSDVNPPVHAWAAWRVFQIDRARRGGAGDRAFLERVFHKLLLNFTWWVNRTDVEDRNLFEGGFLGLDNIGVFDRSQPLPPGVHIHQSDGTSWMAMYALNLMRIALELALEDPVYQDIATKFFEHFLRIAEAMSDKAGEGLGLWDEEDEFFHDVLHLPDGRRQVLRLRSVVGLIPLFAVETVEPEMLERLPEFRRRLEWLLEHRPRLASLVSRWHEPGRGERRLLSLLRGHRMKCLLRRMLDEAEFLSPHGVRALSKVYHEHPFTLRYDGFSHTVRYEPGESASGVFGGNSNWRGPVWFPMNYLIIESLQQFHHYYGDDFRIECPTGSGRLVSILEVAEELTRRLVGLFLEGGDGCRPFARAGSGVPDLPELRDRLLFFEYFHGDTGAGLGASHQTGWTALVAKLLQPRRPPR